MCFTSIGASCGCSLLTDRAAHSDEHSRFQPQEQIRSQRDLGSGTSYALFSDYLRYAEAGRQSR
jgi:hypothetical protein